MRVWLGCQSELEGGREGGREGEGGGRGVELPRYHKSSTTTVS